MSVKKTTLGEFLTAVMILAMFVVGFRAGCNLERIADGIDAHNDAELYMCEAKNEH